MPQAARSAIRGRCLATELEINGRLCHVVHQELGTVVFAEGTDIRRVRDQRSPRFVINGRHEWRWIFTASSQRATCGASGGTERGRPPRAGRKVPAAVIILLLLILSMLVQC